MASERPDLEEDDGGGGGGESDLDEDLAGNEEEEDLEGEDLNSPSTSATVPLSAVAVTPIAAMMSLTSTPATDSVTVAIPSVAVAAIPIDSDLKRSGVTEIVKPHFDDSRRLFQRLWTDEDEIELLRGFLEYTTSHRGSGGGVGGSQPPDTGPFYEQIKSRLQLDFNKNQLVEKLRRLKKKYRNVMSKMISGKEISFKSLHDHATFEISRKIWSETGKIIGFEDNNNVLDMEETGNIHVDNPNNGLNLNSSSSPNFDAEVENAAERRLNSNSSGSKKRSRSRSRRMEEEKVVPGDGFIGNANAGNNSENVGGGANVAGVIEETVRSCLSPVVEMLNGMQTMMMNMGGVPYGGAQGMATWSPLAMPPHLGFARMVGFGIRGEDGKEVDERWRKQQILELEVYSRRLELVQDEIKATVEKMRSTSEKGG